MHVCMYQKGYSESALQYKSERAESLTFECDSCDNTCTKKDTLRIHKGVKHKAKLSNCDECDYF